MSGELQALTGCALCAASFILLANVTTNYDIPVGQAAFCMVSGILGAGAGMTLLILAVLA